MSKFQSYNSRTKKWVLFENGKIKKTSDSKFPGVSVKKGKSGSSSKKKRKSNKKGSLVYSSGFSKKNPYWIF